MAYVSVDVCADETGAIWRVEASPERVIAFGGSAYPCSDWPIFPRIAAAEDRALVVYVGHDDDQARLITDQGDERALGPAHGGQPVAIRSTHEGAFFVWVVSQAVVTAYHVDADGRDLTPPWRLPSPVPGTSQGLLDCEPELVWTDLARIRTIGARRLHLWMQRGSWTVGQVDRSEWGGPVDTIGLYHRSGAWFLSREPRPTQLPPRLAVNFAGDPIVAVTDAAAGFLTIEAFEEWSAPVPPPAGGPGGPVHPAPVPAPPDPPGAGMPYTNRLDVAQEVDRRFPQLLARARREGEPFRGAFVDQLAHTLNRIDRTDRWGRKYRRDQDPSSANDDALTYRLDADDRAKKKLIDVVEGADYRPSWDLRPAHEEPGNGFWGPPLAADLEAGGSDPGDENDTPPRPPTSDSAKLDEILSLLRRVFR